MSPAIRRVHMMRALGPYRRWWRSPHAPSLNLDRRLTGYCFGRLLQHVLSYRGRARSKVPMRLSFTVRLAYQRGWR